MTREEAIKQLDTMWKMLTSAYDDIADSHVAAYTMAVDALKAQGTCEDAVSRQTLQKELALYPIDDVTSEDEAGYNRAINDVQKMVLHLPSAQLEKAQLSGENATFDCISRQDAIDHWRLIIDATSTDSRYNMGFVDGLEFCISHLSTMPSAQPEPCEYYALCRHGRDESKLRERLKFCEYCNEDSDGYVAPIEKNNNAFVRFGMNGWELNLQANGWHGSAKIRYCPMCGRDLFVK